MNSDNSQHSKDNWVQKTVRNLEGMNKARHASADQNNDKPASDYLKSKRNSAPVSIVTSMCECLYRTNYVTYGHNRIHIFFAMEPVYAHIIRTSI